MKVSISIAFFHLAIAVTGKFEIFSLKILVLFHVDSDYTMLGE